MNHMTISKAAREAEVGVETIRFYERKGLIDQPPKPRGPGFREYPIATVQRIVFIRQAQEIGFSLREIEELLSLRADPTADCSDMRDRAAAKLKEVDRKIARLSDIRGALKELVAACPGRGALRTCTILGSLTAAQTTANRPARTDEAR